MGFLDRFQGSKTDPMVEVSANAVAHLREQNLKFQKFMLDKVQDLEEKAAMGQQRLSEPGADDADFGDTDLVVGTDSIGSDFNDYVVDTEGQPAGEEDVRISLEAGVPLTEVAEQAPVEAERTPEPASLDPEPQPEPEQAPEEEAGPPNWEALFGVGTAMPGAAEAAADGAAVNDEVVVSELAGTESETEIEEETASEAAEPESDATGPAKTAPETAIEAAETAENVPTSETVPQEVIMPPQESTAAQEPPSGGGSLLWDWRSLSTQDTDDGSEQAPTDIDPAWEPEAAEEVAAVENRAGQAADPDDNQALDAAANEEISDENTESPDTVVDEIGPDLIGPDAGDLQALPAVEEDTQEPADEQFILLGDTQEQGDMVEIPLPDELGEFS